MRHRLNVLVALAACVSSFGAVIFPALVASAADADHVAGIVTSAEGVPLPGIHVELADALDPGTLRATTYTDRDGRFNLATDRDDVVVVAYDTVPNRLGPTPVRDGAAIAVDGDVDLGTVVMTHGATVSGTLTSSAGGPINHAYAALSFAPDGTPDQGTVTDRDGHYVLSGLAPGTHHVTFWDFAHDPVAIDVTVARDQQVSGVDATMTAREPTAQELAETDVTGRVIDSAGRPVANVGVYALPDDEPFSHLGSGPEGWTDAHGIYRLQHVDPSSSWPAGARYRLLFREIDDDDFVPNLYQVRAGDDTFGVAPTYYPGSPTFAGGQEFRVGTNPAGPLQDVVLGAAGGISGTLVPPRSSDGSLIPYYARAFDAAGHVADEALVAPGGEYRLRDLQPGAYLVHFSFSQSADEPAHWWRSGPREQAQPVTVGAGSRTAGIGTVPDRPLPFPAASTPVTTAQPPATVSQAPTSTSAQTIATAPTPSTTSARATVRGTRVVLRATVSTSGGTVTVSEHGRIRGSAPVLDGHAVVRLKRPHRGRHVYTVAFSGTSSVTPSAATARVRVR